MIEPHETPLGWLNYHHLFYFWTVVREGSVTAAGKKLRLSQPTVSEQIKRLESTFDIELFSRLGNKMVLTEQGASVYRYAAEIFSKGEELLDSLRGQPSRQRYSRLNIGATDVVHKLVTRRLLEPVLATHRDVMVACQEGRPDALLASLAVHGLDVVLMDAPFDIGIASIRATSHFLGESGVSFFAHRSLAGRVKRGFPQSLQDAPFLAPVEGTALRRSLRRWFQNCSVRPQLRGEFTDSALLKTFGEIGIGVFAAPTAIEADVIAQYRVVVVGRSEEVRERFYAVTVKRQVNHPAVQTLLEAARNGLFGASVLHPSDTAAPLRAKTRSGRSSDRPRKVDRRIGLTRPPG